MKEIDDEARKWADENCQAIGTEEAVKAFKAGALWIVKIIKEYNQNEDYVDERI